MEPLSCIHTDPAAIVDDFVMLLRDGFQRHGIATEVHDHDLPASCKYVVDYTTLCSWYFKRYVSHAEILISVEGRLVASATYHHNGKGGLETGKWRGARGEMELAIDELLADSHG